jgi:hypothetical protein
MTSYEYQPAPDVPAYLPESERYNKDYASYDKQLRAQK